MDIRVLEGAERAEAAREAGSVMVSRGQLHVLEHLPGYYAADEDGNTVGEVFYHIENRECEVVSLESRRENRGAGTELIGAVVRRARDEGCTRVWLITSNDNTRAIRFYQKRGLDLKAVHRDAITEARKLKPSIPLIGMDGIPIRHELEFELTL
ncbi:acetyltransferase [Paenibacillus stellifer]|uniref:Acetyltransferase n=1 Tax=Paenibacillus stellifer TaxID=169760 RepID=A0A089LWP0_9BACL|nr:GNAT family N-acetyltransferase [Paenibacillus stellifer]AIQ63678.1 acetyltransferase [Paenibacillus stellifer]